MAALLTDLGLFFTQCLTWVGSLLTVVTSTPALLIMCIAMPVVGFGVGLLCRLFRV